MEKRRAIIIAGAITAALFVGPGLAQSVWMSWQQRALASKQRRLESLSRSLEAERRRLTSDPVYVEGLIRSTFKVAKPNEIVLPSDTLDVDASR